MRRMSDYAFGLSGVSICYLANQLEALQGGISPKNGIKAHVCVSHGG